MNQKKLVNFLGFWVANTVVILLASVIFGNNIVLGNANISKSLAAIASGLITSAVLFLVPWIVAKTGYKIKDRNIWAAIFFIANVLVLWIIKRLAFVSGLGISGIVWVVILAVIMLAVQRGVAKVTGEMVILKK